MSTQDDETQAGVPPASTHRRVLHADPYPAGHTFDGLTIVAFLGGGGFSEVYSAKREDGSVVAVKVLTLEMSDSVVMVERFRREISAMQQLRHPGVVQVFGGGLTDDARPYYVMELLEGPTLNTFLKLRVRLEPQAAYSILAPVLDALSAAHDLGIIHRDIKGANIIVVGEEGAQVGRLLDFGVAKLLGADVNALTRMGETVGSASCMSPEQIRGEAVDARTDIYALGILLYTVLAGRPPFFGRSSLEMERFHLEEQPRPPSKFGALAPAIDALVLRCLEKDQNLRFASVRELKEALREASAERAVSGGALDVVALHVHAQLIAADDGACRGLDAALELAQQQLTTLGFVVVRRSNTTLLAARGPIESSAWIQAGQQTLAEARDLYRALRALDPAASRLHLNVTAHIGRAVGSRGPPLVLTEGAVLSVETWLPHDPAEGAGGTAALTGMIDSGRTDATDVDGKR